MAIRIGIGSWSDDEYRGVLYPPGLKPAERLRAYAEIFSHVEINSTYYGTPKPETVEKWIDETPPGFLFDIKLHRAFSMSPAKAASNPRDLLGYTLERLQPLIEARKLGIFLLLLPARFGPGKHGVDELDRLAERLKPFPLAVEMRDPAWVEGKQRDLTLQAFRDRELVWVTMDMPPGKGFMPPVDEVTRPGFGYLRLHGRNREGYLSGKTAAEQHEYLYNPAELLGLADRIRAMAIKAPELRVVANNHARDYAPRTALELTRLLEASGQECGWRRNANTMQTAKSAKQTALAASAADPARPTNPNKPAITAKAKKKPANSSI